MVISSLTKRKNDSKENNKNDCRPMKRNYLLVPSKSNFANNVFDLKTIQKIE